MQKDVYLFIHYLDIGFYIFWFVCIFNENKIYSIKTCGTSSASFIVCLKNPKIELSKQ